MAANIMKIPASKKGYTLVPDFSSTNPASKTEKKKKKLEMEIFIYLFNIPAKGGPTTDATPWVKSTKPKALVNFSRPKNSTITIGRNETNGAGNEISILL